jgi:hypothetical protein
MPLKTMAALRLSRDPHGPALDGDREALRVHLAAIESGNDLEAHATHIGCAMPSATWPTARGCARSGRRSDHGYRQLIGDQALRRTERDAMMHRRLVGVLEEGDEATIAAQVEDQIRYSAGSPDRIGLSAADGRPAPCWTVCRADEQGRYKLCRDCRRRRPHTRVVPTITAANATGNSRARTLHHWVAGAQHTCLDAGERVLDPPALRPRGDHQPLNLPAMVPMWSLRSRAPLATPWFPVERESSLGGAVAVTASFTASRPRSRAA